MIPNRDGRLRLDACLRSVAAQTLPGLEVIVVDNGSRDGSIELLAERHADVRVLVSASNRGFAAAVNAGAAAARGEALLLLNNDVELDAACVESLLRGLDRHPRAAAVCARLLRADDERVLDGAGDALTRSLKAFRRGDGEPADGRFLTEEEVFSAPGTVALWRASAFRRLGGFDEAFFAYYEDVDLGLRARLHGYEFWYVPSAVARHVRGATSASRRREFDSYWAVRNRLAMIARAIPRGWLLRDAHLIVLGELASLAAATVRGDLRHVLRAYAHTIESSPRLLRDRRAILAGATAGWRDVRLRSDRSFPPVRRRR